MRHSASGLCMNNKTLVLSLFCLVGLTEAVWAQPSPQAECESSSACVSLFEQAQQQSKAGQLAEAEKSYKLAYEVTHDARLLFNIARVLDKQGKELEALTYYRQFLAAPVSDEEQKTKARGYVAQLEDKAMLRQMSAARALSAMTRKSLPAPTSNGEGNVAPVYKRGGFWGVVIGSAAVVGLGVGLGVGLSNRGPTVPGGTNTAEPTF